MLEAVEGKVLAQVWAWHVWSSDMECAGGFVPCYGALFSSLASDAGPPPMVSEDRQAAGRAVPSGKAFVIRHGSDSDSAQSQTNETCLCKQRETSDWQSNAAPRVVVMQLSSAMGVETDGRTWIKAET